MPKSHILNCLSDTREAAIWLEKHGQIENYAALRNTSVEDIYDRRIFDFCFDKNGKQLLDIGTTVIELTLTSRFTVELYDTVTGKPLKSIPKKNTDPEIYQRSCAFLKDIPPQEGSKAQERHVIFRFCQ